MGIAIRGLCSLLQVFDMSTSLRFYRDVLGFSEVGKSGPGDDVDWVWLRHGDAEVMLNTAYEKDSRPDAPEAARVAAHCDTGLFMSCPDLDGAYAHLVAHGVKARPPQVAPYGMKQLYATDPDGYELCLQWPVERAKDAGPSS
jgi:glyoxylase I family protein